MRWQKIETLPEVTRRTEVLCCWKQHKWDTFEVLTVWPDGSLTDAQEEEVHPEEMPTHWATIVVP